eukprot:TRINITY_DN25007_c0_g1_i1.p1 TRINITY_DN25007_c0_g1~~TRINITY_DN25007_c0_g1_i1.p1  ORF type:complete len:655 (+),score=164.83 TRINITY_DN25007_c0_g1_i1:24-1988(+)
MFGANLATIPPGVDGQACLAALRERVAGADGPTKGSVEDKRPYLRSDHMLVRFLIARQWDVEKATCMIREHYRFLETKKLEELLLRPFPEEPFIKKYYPQSYHGTDKQGRPLYIERPGLIDMPRLMQHVQPHRLVEYFAVESEKQVRRRLPACSLARGEVVDKSLNIVDLEGLSLSLVSHSTARKVVSEITKTNQNQYPEMMGKLIIVNAPWVFKSAWSFVKTMLDEKTLAKISIYGTDKEAFSQALLELVEPSQLPALYGGQCMCNGKDPASCMMHLKGPWVDPEIEALLDSQPLEYLMTPEGAGLLKRGLPAAAAGGYGGQKDASQDNSGQNTPATPVQEEAAAVSDDEEAKDEIVQLKSLPPALNMELEQVNQSVRELVEEHKKMEAASILTVEQWVEERNEMVATIGRYAIERAQRYYDCKAVCNKIVEEFVRQQDDVNGLTQSRDESVRALRRAEDAFECFLTGGAGDLTDEEWEQLVSADLIPDNSEIPELRSDPKLVRSYRVSVLSDRVSRCRRQLDAAVAQAQDKAQELAEAQRVFEQENDMHRCCGPNCSVKRAAPYFERCKAHDAKIDQDNVALQAMEQRLHAARRRIVEIQLGEQQPSMDSKSMLSAKYGRMRKFDEMSLKSFELAGAERSDADFVSCCSNDS